MMRRTILLLPIVTSLAACGKPASKTADVQVAPVQLQDGTVPLTAEQAEALGIRYAIAHAATEVPLGVLPATIAPPPNARVAVAATLPGVITRTFVVEGDRVRAGQPLATVASREMLGIGAALQRAQARTQVARAADSRLAQLAREGVIAGARADEARAQRSEAEAELVEQRRALALVNGNARGATYTLIAPVAGRVAFAAAQSGSPVDGTSAPYLIDVADQYEVSAQLPERLIGRVRAGMIVALADGVRGTVTSVGTVVDATTRSATLRARLPAAQGVVAGRAASVTLLSPAPAGAMAVPASAVVTIGGHPTVFVRTRRGVMPRQVVVSDPAAGLVAVISGLHAGQQVAIRGASELKALAGGS